MTIRSLLTLAIMAATTHIQLAYADGGWVTTTVPPDSGWGTTTSPRQTSCHSGFAIVGGRCVKGVWVEFTLDGFGRPICPEGALFNPEGWAVIMKSGTVSKNPEVCFAIVLSNK